MKREDEVLCAACEKPFSIGLIDMVRRRSPMWCEDCTAKVDAELEEATQRAEMILQLFGER
jgi:hypothetical protein